MTCGVKISQRDRHGGTSLIFSDLQSKPNDQILNFREWSFTMCGGDGVFGGGAKKFLVLKAPKRGLPKKDVKKVPKRGAIIHGSGPTAPKTPERGMANKIFPISENLQPPTENALPLWENYKTYHFIYSINFKFIIFSITKVNPKYLLMRSKRCY